MAGNDKWKGQAQDYGKVNFDFVLMTQIQDIGKQLARLPHESIMQGFNEPVGTTHADIIVSYCDMVEHLEFLLEAYQDEAYKKESFNDKDRFEKSKKRFGGLIRLCHRCNFLFTKIRVKASGEDAQSTD